jgi:hypothetical protein
MNRKRVLEAAAAVALVLVVAGAGAVWYHRWQLDQGLVKAVWYTRPALVRELLARGANPGRQSQCSRHRLPSAG